MNNDHGTGRKSHFNILSMVQILLILSVKIKKQRDLYENDVYKDRIRSNNNTFRSKLIITTIRNIQEEMYKLGCSKLYKLVHDG